MELYQAEWCPHAHKVRQRLTELGVEYFEFLDGFEERPDAAAHRDKSREEAPEFAA